MTRALLSALAALLCSSTADAQPLYDTFDRLPLREVDVYVVPERGAEIRGRLIAFDQDWIAVWIDGRRWTFLREDVRRIYKRGDSIMNGAGIGMIAGAVAGIGLGIAAGIDACDDSLREWETGCVGLATVALTAVVMPLSITVGMVAGATIDALHRGRTLVYERRSGPTIGLTPVVTRQRQGLSMSISW